MAQALTRWLGGTMATGTMERARWPRHDGPGTGSFAQARWHSHVQENKCRARWQGRDSMGTMAQ
jgi:hypothetical protein